MPNLFGGFKVFCEEHTRPDSFVSQIKKQVHVPKKLWFGMPVVISNTKLGEHLIREPTAFYVVDFDSHTVTIKPVPYAYNDEDMDDEIDLADDHEEGEEYTITRDNFFRLLEPPNYQGADFNGAGSAIQWKSAGNTLNGPMGGGMGGPPMGGM